MDATYLDSKDYWQDKATTAIAEVSRLTAEVEQLRLDVQVLTKQRDHYMRKYEELAQQIESEASE